MAIFVMCSSAYPPEETRQKSANANERYHDILKHFWISDVREPLEHEQEHATEHGITVKSGFLIQWNKKAERNTFRKSRASFPRSSAGTRYWCSI